MKFAPGVQRKDLDTALAKFSQDLSFIAMRGFKADRMEIAKLRDVMVTFSNAIANELNRYRPIRHMTA